ncbi:MAG: DUF2089 domain-containing protein [Candidatus Dormiibacterota bacterium]
MNATEHRPPRDCPVCGEALRLTRLSCRSCGTELTGDFEACEFCALGSEDRELLKVFLGSRGNMKALERSLAVSYPTARARLDAVLTKLGIEPGGPAPAEGPLDLLQALARGEVSVEEARSGLDQGS